MRHFRITGGVHRASTSYVSMNAARKSRCRSEKLAASRICEPKDVEITLALRLIIKTVAQDASRTPTHDCVRRHILRNQSTRADHSPSPDPYAGAKRSAMPDPDVGVDHRD